MGFGSRIRVGKWRIRIGFHTSNAPSVEIGYGFGLARQSRHSKETGVAPMKPPTLNMGKGGVYTIKTSIGVSDPLVPLGV